MRASSPSRALSLLTAVAVLLAAQTTVPASAQAAATGPATGSATGPAPTSREPDPPRREAPDDPTDAPPPAPISPEAVTTASEPPPPTTPTLGKPLHDAPGPGARDQPTIVAPANNVSPTTGMGGRMMSTTDPEARRAKAELEGTALDKGASADVPKRLPPQQRHAWWSMFGAFALGSAAGVFAGLAEVQEDKAERLAITLDSMTGSALIYSEVQSEYEQILRVGRRDAGIAKGLLAGAGGFLAAGIALFIVDAVKTRRAKRPNNQPNSGPNNNTRPAVRVGAARGGIEVRF